MQKLTLLRLEKEAAELERNPIQNALVCREGTFNFHFCLHNLHPPYAGGFYHGLLELHENYPFRAPRLYFFTPSGRFEVNTPICTSFTNYHQQSWTSAWNVRTLIIATISFMYSDEPSFGCRKDSDALRATLARQSRNFNLKNPFFLAHFASKLPREHSTELQSLLEHPSDRLIKQEQSQHEEQELGAAEGEALAPGGGNRRGKLLAGLAGVMILLFIAMALSSQ